MDFETAEVSLLGDRETNQDRATIVANDSGLLLAVADGMGGHAGGAEAAAMAIKTVVDAFRHCPQPIEDPETFLESVVLASHRAVVALGDGLPFEERPRTTLVACVVMDDVAHWCHVGDSRLYHFRGTELEFRTRDHSHVELLFQQGKIKEEEMLTHPYRHFVESCLGGDPARPWISVETDRQLEEGDSLLLCSDGMWTPYEDSGLAEFLGGSADLQLAMDALAAKAVEVCGPQADNTTGVAFRLMAD